MRASVVPYSSFRGLGVGVGVAWAWGGVAAAGSLPSPPPWPSLCVSAWPPPASLGSPALSPPRRSHRSRQGGAGRGRALGRGVRRAVGRKRYDDDAHHRQTQRAGRHRGDHPRVPPADLGAQRRKHPPRGAASFAACLLWFPKNVSCFLLSSVSPPRRAGRSARPRQSPPAQTVGCGFLLLSVYQGYPQSTKGISTYHISSGGFCQTAGPPWRPRRRGAGCQTAARRLGTVRL